MPDKNQSNIIKKHDIRLAVIYLKDNSLTYQERFLLLLISNLINDDMICYWGNDSLSELTNLGRTTIIKYMRSLYKKKYLTLIEQGGGKKRTNKYQINTEHLFEMSSYKVKQYMSPADRYDDYTGRPVYLNMSPGDRESCKGLPAKGGSYAPLSHEEKKETLEEMKERLQKTFGQE